ncbi:MAG: Fe-S oxidoreductase, partial [Gammaproteobacteria bacterium]|nr:Fe-S oxidoreductase [Gammaproteobacteria bacterium]
MSTPPEPQASRGREGSLEAPTRHPIQWQTESFYDAAELEKELERVFDICHGCRRCFSLCNAFPTLFDAVDATSAGEVAAVEKAVYWDVVDHCYLCDMCFMTKCPYVPPHPWNVDFPHLMLRAKATRSRTSGLGRRERLLAATDAVGRIAGIPVVAEIVNAVNATRAGRTLLEKVLGVARDAPLPTYQGRSARRRLAALGYAGENPAPEGAAAASTGVQATAETRGRVALFTTCYGNRCEPALDEDLVAVFAHNGIAVALLESERCCGMPRLEI